jgi:adenine-specific DNA-methyltransferase
MDISQINTVMHGDCVAFMRRMESESTDFILTDPPYIMRYRSRDGRTVINHDNARWLRPAFTQMYRLLKNGSFCVSFYGWNKADLFISAWRAAGFRIVGHIVFRKRYASSARFCDAFKARLLLRSGLTRCAC